MANKKELIIIFVVTLVVVLLLVAWVGNRKGDVALLGQNDLPGVEIPLSPAVAEDANEVTEDDALDINVLSMETQNVIFKTNKGDVTVELFTGAMPITTANFLKLAAEGFYDGTKFHRVIDGFMVQGGDPNSKGNDVTTYGTGGPGYAIDDEHVAGDLLTNTRGTLAMANSGPNTGGSQFFINLVDNTYLDFDKEPLQSKHPVFGRVVEGMEIVDEISKVEVLPRDIPVTPVVVESVVIAES